MGKKRCAIAKAFQKKSQRIDDPIWDTNFFIFNFNLNLLKWKTQNRNCAKCIVFDQIVIRYDWTNKMESGSISLWQLICNGQYIEMCAFVLWQIHTHRFDFWPISWNQNSIWKCQSTHWPLKTFLSNGQTPTKPFF